MRSVLSLLHVNINIFLYVVFNKSKENELNSEMELSNNKIYPMIF